jgi:hypothetical protein
LSRIRLNRRSHVTGFQPLATGSTEFGSALGRDFVTLTSFLDPTASITAQPVTLCFREGQKLKRYTPDFLVRSRIIPSELVEVRYEADLLLHRDRLQPGFSAARIWAFNEGLSFRAVTDREIRTPLLENAKRLAPLRTAPMDALAAEELVGMARLRPNSTFGSLVSRFTGDRSAALATLWRLMARSQLRTDLTQSITYESAIWAP